jgi:hypothetical protein
MQLLRLAPLVDPQEIGVMLRLQMEHLVLDLDHRYRSFFAVFFYFTLKAAAVSRDIAS